MVLVLAADNELLDVFWANEKFQDYYRGQDLGDLIHRLMSSFHKNHESQEEFFFMLLKQTTLLLMVTMHFVLFFPWIVSDYKDVFIIVVCRSSSP
jgi:hypothetical protein